MSNTDETTKSADPSIRTLLHGQTAPRAGHGVRVLWRCRTCGYPWLQDARLPHGARVRLPVEDAARYAACSRDRLYDLVQLGKLRPGRDGRRLVFRRSDLDRYLQGEA